MRTYTGDEVLETMVEYATRAVLKNEPTPEQYQLGGEELFTLPAGWWNWLLGKLTNNERRASLATDDLYSELLTVLREAGITPDPANHNQLSDSILTLIDAGIRKKSSKIRVRYIDTPFSLSKTDLYDTYYDIVIAVGATSITFPALPADMVNIKYLGMAVVNLAPVDLQLINVYSAISTGTMTLHYNMNADVYITPDPKGGSPIWASPWMYTSNPMGNYPVAYTPEGRLKANKPVADDEVLRVGDSDIWGGGDFYAFEIIDGDLYQVYNTGDTPPHVEINADGDLILTIQ